MFFLGLLSTPLPYLLLAAFYFFGFAMGMFNSKSDEDITENNIALTIPAEVKEKSPDLAVFYFNAFSEVNHDQITDLQIEVKPSTYPPDIRQQFFRNRNTEVPQFFLNGFRFSRPPPSFC